MKYRFYDDIQREMNRILEEQRQFSRLLEQAADPLREIREAIEQGSGRVAQFQLISQNISLVKDRFSLEAALESAIGQDARNLARSIQNEFRDRIELEVFEALHRPEIDTALASVLRHQEELAEITAAIFRNNYCSDPTNSIRPGDSGGICTSLFSSANTLVQLLVHCRLVRAIRDPTD